LKKTEKNTKKLEKYKKVEKSWKNTYDPNPSTGLQSELISLIVERNETIEGFFFHCCEAKVISRNTFLLHVLHREKQCLFFTHIF
jgi:hypothetical protein